MKSRKKMFAHIALFSTLSLAAFVLAPTVACAVDIAIAPGALIIEPETDCTLDCDAAEEITVHAGINYSTECDVNDVSPCSVDLCNADSVCLESTAVFADSRGDLVAKFQTIAVIEMLLEPLDYNTYYDLTLVGDEFDGMDSIFLKAYQTEPIQEPVGPMGPGTHSVK